MERNCPECGASLQAVRVLDATHSLPAKTGGAHVDLSYASPDAKASLFTKAIPRQGTLRAMMCPDCGRTLFYALPGS